MGFGFHAPLADAGLLDVNGTLLAEIIAFLAMLAILAKYAFPPIQKAADERQKQIEAGLRAAEEAEKRLTAVQADVERTLNEAREQAREVIARASKEAAAEAEEIRQRGRRDAQAQVEKARSDIEAEQARAIQELRSEVSGLVVEAAAKVIGAAIDEKTHRRLIEESIAAVSPRS